ncbi:MAG: hypothetical protein KAR44_03020 [Candidatus Aegiribacteria sp.]|nr:hypothetical protein [Candidatus Aegiribacteria sp.]
MDIKYRMRKLPEYKALASEVVRVLNDRPHLLVRIEVSGEHFPDRAPHPFVMINVGKEEYYKDLFTEVSPDNRKIIGYLPINIPSKGVIVFGYGDEIWGTVPGRFTTTSVARLERNRLPKNIMIVDDNFLQLKK